MTVLFNCFRRSKLIAWVCFLGMTHLASGQNFRFDFGSGRVKKGYVQVKPGMIYDQAKGYGFLPGSTIKGNDNEGRDGSIHDHVTSDSAFFFSVRIPEGNYDVKLISGDGKGTSAITVKVECRRLMAENIVTKKGDFATTDFTVNVRSPKIDESNKISLKPRELKYLHWDDQLTFEFTGKQPKICALEITKNEGARTIFLAGNSTVVDQAYEPFASWGQMIPRFFKPGLVSVANYAESGESLRSFITAKRSGKIFSQMKKGDYLFIEFAHNDQKQKDLLPFEGYKKMVETLISETRKLGGIPVLVTSMHRRNFDSTGHIVNTLGDFPEAIRLTAKEHQVALIDLNAMSKVLWEALGEEESKKAFVHFPANSFPGQKEALKDNTHFSNYGAYQLAKCVIEGIKKADPTLSALLVPETPSFDPAHPDPFDSFDFPQSPLVETIKPDGN